MAVHKTNKVPTLMEYIFRSGKWIIKSRQIR